MQISTLQNLYPQFTVEELQYLRTRFNNVKGRCNSKSEHHKHYHNVECMFTLLTFIDWVIAEKQKGRDLLVDRKLQVSRVFDSGNYAPENCKLLDKTTNVKQAHTFTFRFYDVSNGNEMIIGGEGIRAFYKLNEERLSISLATFYRRVRAKQPILFTNGKHSGLCKVEAI